MIKVHNGTMMIAIPTTQSKTKHILTKPFSTNQPQAQRPQNQTTQLKTEPGKQMPAPGKRLSVATRLLKLKRQLKHRSIAMLKPQPATTVKLQLAAMVKQAATIKEALPPLTTIPVNLPAPTPTPTPNTHTPPPNQHQ